MDTRGQCVTVAAVLPIHMWIHVASGVTVAAVLPIHIWIHVASGVTVAAVLAIHIWIHELASGRITNTDMLIGQLNTCAELCRIGKSAGRHQGIPSVMGRTGIAQSVWRLRSWLYGPGIKSQ